MRRGRPGHARSTARRGARGRAGVGGVGGAAAAGAHVAAGRVLRPPARVRRAPDGRVVCRRPDDASVGAAALGVDGRVCVRGKGWEYGVRRPRPLESRGRGRVQRGGGGAGRGLWHVSPRPEVPPVQWQGVLQPQRRPAARQLAPALLAASHDGKCEFWESDDASSLRRKHEHDQQQRR